MICKTITVLLMIFIVTIHAAPIVIDQKNYPSARVIQPRHMTSDEHVQSIIDFWTEEKFRQAKSPWELYPERFNNNATVVRRLDDTHFYENGPAFAVNSVMGLADSTLKAAANGYGRPTTGKVFWHMGNNYYGMCSASVIASNNRDLLITAAHCMFDHNQGGFLINHNWVFVPGYQHGHRPHDTFPARYMTTFHGWTDSNDWNYDIGMVLLSEVHGRHVQDVVGAQGIGFNFGRNELTYAFGYPLNLDGGEVMQFCRSHAGGHHAGSGYHGQRIDCDMAGGSSGGPWIQLFDTHSGLGYVTSVNSFLLDGQHNSLHGPYFGNDVQWLYDGIKN